MTDWQTHWTFLCAFAAVASLAPKSHGRFLLAPLFNRAPDKGAKDFLDTAGRLIYFFVIIGIVSLIERVLP